MKIVLIGFMGAGKTTIGKLLAKNLSYKYIDMDDLIVKKSGRESDREIFDKDGEQVFRSLEISVSRDLAETKNVVISTGGGVVMNKENIDYLKSNGIMVFLKNAFTTSQKRIRIDNPPPLFRDKQKAKKLYEFRQPLYTKFADITINTDDKYPKAIARELISLLKSYE